MLTDFYNFCTVWKRIISSTRPM